MEGADRVRTPFGAFLRGVGDEVADARPADRPSSAAEVRQWRRLSRETTPVAGESLRGLVARACTRNDLPNSWGLLQPLGQRNRNRVLVSEDANIDPAELAFALRVEDAEVLSRRYPDLGGQHLSFHGLDLHSDAVGTRVRRFSPTFLAENRHHLAVWELDDVPFCLRGWDMLQDTCWCEREGVVQGWTRTLTAVDLCDRCGDPLRWLEPFPVPGDMRDALSLVEPLVDPCPERRAESADRLPAGLRDRDRSTTFHLLRLMARAFDPHAADRSIEIPAERLDGLHRACVALSRWPKGLDDQPWHDEVTDGALKIIRSLWGRNGRSFAAPRSVIAGRGTTASVDVSTDLTRDYVGVRRAIGPAGLSRGTLLAIWEAGLVPKRLRKHGSKSLPAFDLDEIVAVARLWNSRIDVESFANRFGLPAYGVEQLLALAVVDADGIALPGTGPYLRKDAVDRLATRLEETAAARRIDRGEIRDAVPVRQVLLLVGGRPKPWGPILRAMLADAADRDALAFGMGSGRKPADRILVARTDLDRIASMTFDWADHPTFAFADRIVQRDALDMLNATPKGVGVLDGIPARGTNPMTYATSDVEERAAGIVTLREVATLRRVGIKQAERMIEPFPPVTARAGYRAWCRTVLDRI